MKNIMATLIPDILSNIFPFAVLSASSVVAPESSVEDGACPPLEICSQISAPELKEKRSKKSPFYCVCGYGDGDMIGCDGKKCPGNNW